MILELQDQRRIYTTIRFFWACKGCEEEGVGEEEPFLSFRRRHHCILHPGPKRIFVSQTINNFYDINFPKLKRSLKKDIGKTGPFSFSITIRNSWKILLCMYFGAPIY